MGKNEDSVREGVVVGLVVVRVVVGSATVDETVVAVDGVLVLLLCRRFSVVVWFPFRLLPVSYDGLSPLTRTASYDVGREALTVAATAVLVLDQPDQLVQRWVVGQALEVCFADGLR